MADPRGDRRADGAVCVEVPASLDVRSTASCLAPDHRQGSTFTPGVGPNDPSLRRGSRFHVEREGRGCRARVDRRHLRSRVRGAPDWSSRRPRSTAATPGRRCGCWRGSWPRRAFRSRAAGDAEPSGRPMERVAVPLRSMGAEVETTGRARADRRSSAGRCGDRPHDAAVPSAQVKSAVLLAGLAADGRPRSREPAPTRDHTERALAALGGPSSETGDGVTVDAFQHDGSRRRSRATPRRRRSSSPPPPLTGSALTIVGVGLNPTRPAFLEVMARMGVRTDVTHRRRGAGRARRRARGAPVHRSSGRCGSRRDELPLVIDEVPVLALLAAHAGSSRASSAPASSG